MARKGFVLLLLVLMSASVLEAAQTPQIPLAGNAIPKFVDPLPGLDIIPAGTGQIELRMTEFQAPVLPTGFVPANSQPYTGTWVWGYLQPGQTSRASYIGPVIAATRGIPTEMKYVNNLGSAATTNVLAYKYSIDQTLHWADPLNGGTNMCNHMVMFPSVNEVPCAQNYNGPVPAAVHLHGGEVPPQLDGGPDSWFTSDGAYTGHGFYSMDGTSPRNYSIYRYPNEQQGAPIWFHDHTLGATRLNVYAGLAGGYLLLDPANDPQNLPPLTPLVIQDRRFDTNGQLFFPADSAGNFLWTPNPEHPYWVPEFVGDVIVVNGKAWPYLDVAQKRYTFLFLNGSNARTYEMFLVDPAGVVIPPRMWVIGTDDGYLDKPVPVKKLTMMSGERYQVIVDFAGVPVGTRFILKNTAKTPFPGGAASPVSTTGQIIQFRVGAPAADGSFNPAAVGATLRGGTGQGPAIKRLVAPATGTLGVGVAVDKTRQLTLNEVKGMPQAANNPVTGLMTNYPGGPLEILVNNTKWDGKRIVGVIGGMYNFELRSDFPSGVSETPNEGDTEIWEIVNLTVDAHPIHLHLTSFQLMNRQNFDTKAYAAAYGAAFPGGGYDPMTGLPYPAGVFIPGYGPPLNYNTGNPRALGGNPDIAAVGAKGKPLSLQGAVQPPLPEEAGWKDTVIAYPGQVTRLAVRWAPQDVPVPAVAKGSYPFDPNGGDGYVWHCHIVDHEDNEMMRPNYVTPNPAAGRTYIKGTHF